MYVIVVFESITFRRLVLCIRPGVLDSLLFFYQRSFLIFFAGLSFIYVECSAGLCFIVLLDGGRSIFLAAAVFDDKAILSGLELFLS